MARGFEGESVSLGRGSGTVTLVEETAFCLSDRTGDGIVSTAPFSA